MSSSTITLNQSCEWAKRFNFGRDFAFGSALEPALTSANIVMQTVMGPPFAWRWNRVVTGFFTTQGVQDYTLTNWSQSTAMASNWILVDNLGSSQQVTTPGTTNNSTYPTFNQVLGGTTTDGSVTWTNRGNFLSSGLDFYPSDTYTFNWIETSSCNDGTRWYEIESKICLGLDSTQSRPKWISAQIDDGNGHITFRTMPCPDQAYPTVLTLQQKPTIFTSLNQTWSPIPDEYSHIYQWGFLSLMWMFADDPRFAFANQKFVTHLLSSSEGLTETEINIFLNNWQNITGQPIEKADRLVQGVQSRGV